MPTALKRKSKQIDREQHAILLVRAIAEVVSAKYTDLFVIEPVFLLPHSHLYSLFLRCHLQPAILTDDTELNFLCRSPALFGNLVFSTRVVSEKVAGCYNACFCAKSKMVSENDL